MSNSFGDWDIQAKQLTLDQIRKYSEFSSFTDQEALELSNSLRILSEITFEVFTHEQLRSISQFS